MKNEFLNIKSLLKLKQSNILNIKQNMNLNKGKVSKEKLMTLLKTPFTLQFNKRLTSNWYKPEEK